ncbi:MAG: sulfite exporter TauE/SafE family protein [Sulfolobaceae archaeon]
MIDLTTIQYLLVILSGAIVGLILGLIGGGGSVLAIPLLLYLVGIENLSYYPKEYLVRIVVGSSALSVGIISLLNGYQHKRLGNLRLKEGLEFAIMGVFGTFIGSFINNLTNPSLFLLFFGIFMIIISILMIKNSNNNEKITSNIIMSGKSPIKIFLLATAVGFASGFFGIGGGFLIVPALIYTGLCIKKAIGTSLLVVGAFGIFTSIAYSINGYVDPILSLLFIAGGIIGGRIGIKYSILLPKTTLRRIFSIALVIIGAYIIIRAISP